MTHPVMWFEVLGKDGDALRNFYGKLFGWTFDANPDVTLGVFEDPEGHVIGLVEARPA